MSSVVKYYLVKITLVSRPFPSMPVYFWNDPDGKLYRAAYFDKFEGVWAHGDFLVIDPVTGGMVMLGRSGANVIKLLYGRKLPLFIIS